MTQHALWTLVGAAISLATVPWVGGSAPAEGTLEGNCINDNYHGFVQIYEDGEWGNVCGEPYNSVALHLICHSLGFFSASVYAGVLTDEPTKLAVTCPFSSNDLASCDYTYQDDCPEQLWITCLGTGECGWGPCADKVCEEEPDAFCNRVPCTRCDTYFSKFEDGKLKTVKNCEPGSHSSESHSSKSHSSRSHSRGRHSRSVDSELSEIED